jgi:hypothetical protein
MGAPPNWKQRRRHKTPDGNSSTKPTPTTVCVAPPGEVLCNITLGSRGDRFQPAGSPVGCLRLHEPRSRKTAQKNQDNLGLLNFLKHCQGIALVFFQGMYEERQKEEKVNMQTSDKWKSRFFGGYCVEAKVGGKIKLSRKRHL